MSTLSKANKRANPSLTRNNRPRLKPLTISQLQERLEKATRPRDASKIRNRIKFLEARG